MRKLILLCPIIALTLLVGCNEGETAEYNDAQACIKNQCFNVEVVKDSKALTKGLMDRKKLKADQGMLLNYTSSDKYAVWMKNMNFSLDIIWLNKKKEVVYLHENAPPCETEQCDLYTPDKNAKYILEVPAGSIAKIGIEVGDTMELTNNTEE